MPVRVVIAEDNRLVREGIEQILALDDGLEVAASCASLPELIDAVEREAPDLVLTDLRMPPSHDDEGIRVAARLRETHPEIGVIVVSHYADPLISLKLIETASGGRGYLLKAQLHRAAQLAAAIKAVAKGGIVIDSTLVAALMADASRFERLPLAELGAREREILAELAQGKSDAAIADSLALSADETAQQIGSIAARLGIADAKDIAQRVTAALALLIG